MANPAADAKAAPLADDLKDFALYVDAVYGRRHDTDAHRTLPTSVFPKTFFCALDNQLAIDSYKLLCCNKAICPSCESPNTRHDNQVDVLTPPQGQEKLSFPTTCPSCDHSPLEADSCAPNKALRNTMRVWLQKQKKKEEAKAAAAASQAPSTPVETTPAAPEVQPVGDIGEKPVESIEEASKAGAAGGEQVAADKSGDADERAGSVAVQPAEVGLYHSDSFLPSRTDEHETQDQDHGQGANSLCLARMNMIVAARASDRGVHFTSYISTHRY
jgi:hypothetical protein